MSVSKLIDEQMKVFRQLEERFKEKPTAEGHKARIAELSGAQEARIKARIARLQAHKKATVARIDAAIAAEEATLKTIAAHTPSLRPDDAPGPDGDPAGKPGGGGGAKGGRRKKVPNGDNP